MLALFLLLFSFLLYLLTLTPTVGLHDSGDMTTACWSMGICHPTGYPLYTIFGKLFITLIPIGSIAYRMNCLSAIFASLAVMMVYFIILKLISFQFAIRNPQSAILSSIVASLILAFSATFWEQAVIAEKYTLNAFFFSLLTFLLLKWQEVYSLKLKAYSYLYLFIFVLGLSFAHHFQTTYIIPGSIFFILATLWNHRATKAQRKKKSPQITQITQIFSIRNSQFAIRNLLLFLLPLFLWLYLPIAASFNPPLNWNNPQDLFGFINHITGFGYKALFSLPSITRLISQNLPRILSDQFSVSLIFSLLGVIFLFRKNLLFFIFLLPTICINIYLALGYNIPNIQDYYIPFFLYLSILIGCGLAFILSFIRIQRLSFLFLLLPLIPLYLHYPFCNRSKHYFVYDHTVSLLNTLSKNSVSFYTMDYNIFPLWYLLYVENRDERIMPILYPYFHQDWVLRTLNTIIPEAKIDPTLSRGKPYNELDEILRRRFDTLVTNNPNLSVYLDFKGAVPPSHILVPKGFVYYVAKADIDLGKFLDENPPIFRFRLIHDESIKKNWRIEMIIKEYSKGWKERGGFYSMLGRYKDGLYSYKKALELCENDPEIHKEMGRNYVLLEEYDAAMSSYNKALKLNPVYTDCFADLGVLYFKMGKQDMAISSLKEALSINPEHSEAKRNLSLLITKK